MATKKPKNTALPQEQKPLIGGVIHSPDLYRETAKGKRFILTCAQNNTKIHSAFWTSLKKFAAHIGAQIMVSRFSYNKNGWQKITKDHVDNDGELWYAPEITSYIQDDQIKLAKDLVFCAELDILPTAKDPLSGLDNYTGGNSMVVPHAKVHLRSYAGLRSAQPVRFGYTTGTVTMRNYIDRRAGQIASYHHVYGALLVEVDDNGEWYARQIIADDDGSFFDLNTYVDAYNPVMHVSSKHVVDKYDTTRVINLGDVHAEKIDPVVFTGAKEFVKYVCPSDVVVHDLLDFEARNHHNIKDQFFLADQYFNGMNTVEANIKHAVTVLDEISRQQPDANLILVRSNHDMALLRWLKEHDGIDVANAVFYHHVMCKYYTEIVKGNPSFDVYAWVLEEYNKFSTSQDKWIHIKEDDSYVLHEIEFGLHGHLGPNGARGNPKAYRQLGRKLNTGHTHSASIIDGVWTAGVLASLNMGYNKGPSSWSHSHILTQPNGKRQMITQRGPKWRA